MTDPYLRPGKILSNFGDLYPDAWKRVYEFRAKRNEMKDGADMALPCPWEDFTSCNLGLEEIGVGGNMESQSHLNQTDRSFLHPDDSRRAPPCSNGLRLTEPDMLVRGQVCREDHGSSGTDVT